MNPIQGPQLPALQPPAMPAVNQTPETGQTFKDLLIEAGVPQALKDIIPIVTANGKPVWLAGWRVADAFKTTGKGKVYRLSLRQE